MKRLLCLTSGFCVFLLLTGMVMAAEISNPILKKLVEKGILTEEEAGFFLMPRYVTEI